MAEVSSIRARVRALMRRDKDQLMVQAAQGSTASTVPASTYDLMQQYGHDMLSEQLRLEQDLMSRFIDYEAMDDYPETSAALNIYADDATQPDTPSNQRVWVEASDKDVERLLNNFLHRRIRIEEDQWSIARSLCKMGNCIRQGSRVWTDHGAAEIEDIVAGDRVWGYKDGSLELFTVVQLFDNGVKQTFKLTTDNHEVFVTADHKMLVSENGGDPQWIEAQNLVVSIHALVVVAEGAVQGEQAGEPFETETLLSIEDAGDAQVYDLEVDDAAHNYVVEGVVVHNCYEELVITEDGVIGLNHLPAHTVRRIEGPRGELYGFIQDFQRRMNYSPREFQQLLAKRVSRMQGSSPAGPAHPMPNEYVTSMDLDEAVPFEPWQVVHMRLRTKHRRSIYGMSIFEPARWVWKRLQLLEDSALIYRLQRAAERYAYYISIGTRPPKEGMKLLNRVKNNLKKKRFVNPRTGELDLKYATLAQDEDMFIPVVDGQEGTRVERLSSPNWQHMDDIEFFLRKLFAALLVPKVYLGQESGTARQVLSSEDVRFARSILRVQRELKHGIERICRVHLAAIGIPPTAVTFDIRLTVPSSIFELAQMEVKNARADLASRMREQVSHRWMLKNIHDLSDDDIAKIFNEREEDALRDGRRRGIEELAQQEMMPDEGGGRGGRRFSSREPRTGPGLKTLIEREKEVSKDQHQRLVDGLAEIRQENSSLTRHMREVQGLLHDLRGLVGR